MSSLVSVLMCVRDGADYIGSALDSVQAQRSDGCEVIVIDDGSADGSAQIARLHPVSARVVQQDRLGLPFALNRAFSEACGEFIAWIDADDVWPEDRLRHLIGAFERYPDAECIFGAIVNTDGQLRPLSPALPARVLTATLIRRASAARIGDFRTDVTHAANVDWVSRASAGGLAFIQIDEVVLYRRIHGGNMGVRDKTNARRDMLRVIRDHHLRMRST